MDKHDEAITSIPVTTELDALGLLCPLPVLKLRKRMEPLMSGEKIRVTADDPAAVLDIPHFCNEQGHAIDAQDVSDQRCIFVIMKG
ncbi:MAG: sulfurtransferase TusA family protein [Pseudomonadota bacterium]